MRVSFCELYCCVIPIRLIGNGGFLYAYNSIVSLSLCNTSDIWYYSLGQRSSLEQPEVPNFITTRISVNEESRFDVPILKGHNSTNMENGCTIAFYPLTS